MVTDRVRRMITMIAEIAELTGYIGSLVTGED